MSNTPYIAAWADDAAAALVLASARSVEVRMRTAPPRPGLYAIYASTYSWDELGLGAPIDGRPLYVGKSESSLASRDVTTHFGFTGRSPATSVTGGSTVRRSLAALLHDSHGYRGVPRNPSKPGSYSNYGLTADQDEDLSEWMRQRLQLACWEKPDACTIAQLERVEQAILGRLLPPLNLKDIATSWKPGIESARRVMAAEARAWC